MEVPESSERTGDSVPTTYFIRPPVYKFTEVPDTYVAPESKLCRRLIQLKREASERVGPIVLDSYVNVPPLCGFTELHDSEEMRMINQARLGNELRRKIARRFRDSADSPDEKKSDTSDSVISSFGGPRPPVELQMHEEHRVMKLTNVYLLYPMKPEDGTLEVHTNGFIYTTRSLRLVFMNANVQGSFVRLGDSKWPPLLLFHLKHPIVIEAKETKDIQFCLRHPKPRIRHKKLNKDLKNFVQKVNESHRVVGWSNVPTIPIVFQALEECEFDGALLTGNSATFALTYSALVVLEKGRSLMVIPLLDVVFVNLARCEAGLIDIAVIYDADSKAAVLEIQKVSLSFLTSIKHRLNFALVKYYFNTKTGNNWDLMVRKMSESSEMFVHETSLLEDRNTLALYPDADPGSDSELLEKYGSVQL